MTRELVPDVLLNVGPTAEGEILPPYADRIRALGDWLKGNGEAIYGTDGTAWGTEFSDYDPVTGPANVLAQGTALSLYTLNAPA